MITGVLVVMAGMALVKRLEVPVRKLRSAVELHYSPRLQASERKPIKLELVLSRSELIKLAQQPEVACGLEQFEALRAAGAIPTCSECGSLDDRQANKAVN